MDPPTINLSSREKAAIVVRLLLTYGAVPALSALPETKQTELAVQLAKMTPVDQETVAAVATEFADEIERIGLSFPTGLDGALGILDGVISDGATARLREMAPSSFRGNPWDDVAKADPDRLVGFVLVVLGCMHFFNLFVLTTMRRHALRNQSIRMAGS